MNTAMLLCSIILADDSPAGVQARVLSGASSTQEQPAGLEPWIGRAAARFGSPRLFPKTPWKALTGEFQNLDPAGQSGMPVHGKATRQIDSYTVEIAACEGFPLGGTVTLKPGDRRIMKLTLDAAPNNVFIALKAPVSPKASRRATVMKASLKRFRLNLNYSGEQGKPFYRMIVSVPPIIRRRSSPFERIIQVQEDEAIGIIDHLARDGFLDDAVDLSSIKLPASTMPGYAITATAGGEQWYVDLGWGLPMIHRLDALRTALPDHGQQDAELLLGRLSGLRKRWETEHPPFVASAGRDDSRIQFYAEDNATVIDITSRTGIDKATIRRESPKWPGSLLIRLHLRGLELLNVGNGELSVDWSVSSTGDHTSRVFLRTGIKETALDTTSPYHTPVRIAGGNGKIPLTDGYFEVRLPAKLFDRNPEAITLEWIDFYRN